MLAGQAVEAAKMDDARKKYQDVADHADSNYSSLAKLAIAQIDFTQNRSGEAEALLKDLIAHPTDLVSKEQATIVYAKGIGATRPDEARKLLTPLTTPPSDISPIVTAALADLPQK
jgi:predicted negative regulator of RcsB-dependent stress response